MQFTILALGSRGDILPYAALGQGLRSAGHRVCFVTAESFRQAIAASGLDFFALPGDAQAFVRQAGASMRALVRSFGRYASDFVPNMEGLLSVLGETDLILNQLPGGLCGYDLAQKLGVPMVLAAVMPLSRTRAFPMMGFPTLFSRVPGYNQLTYRVAEQIVWQMFRSSVNRWRQRSLSLPPTSFWGHFDELYERGVPVLNGFSAHVVPRPPDWADHIHVTGYWFPQDAAWQAPEELCRFTEAGPPPVFIGFGSMPLRDPQQTTRLVLRALERSGQRAILHAGWGGLGGRALPDRVLAIDYAPYGWLFPRMAAVVHHGGSGTTAFALRAGVPSLVVPFLFDQFYWGRRIAELGVGPQPIPYRRLSEVKLAEAIALAAEDGAMRRRAAALGAKIRAEDGIGRAVNVLEARVRQT